MSLIGGVIGVAIGLVTARTLTAVLDWPTELSMLTLVSAFAIAAPSASSSAITRPGGRRGWTRSSR